MSGYPTAAKLRDELLGRQILIFIKSTNILNAWVGSIRISLPLGKFNSNKIFSKKPFLSILSFRIKKSF